MHAADRLRELAARLARGDGLEQWFAAALCDYLTNARSGRTLDQALGVAARPGEAPWWRLEAHARRDKALRTLAAHHFGDLGINEQAERIAAAARRYQAARWHHDQHRGAPPVADTPRALLFEALVAGDGRIPGSPRQVRRILSNDPNEGERRT